MRVLLATAVVLVAMSGCFDAGDPSAAPDNDSPRRSVGGSANATDAPHDNIVILDDAVNLVGQATQDFDVLVPANVTNVDFFANGGDTGAFSGFRVEMAGCGMYDQGATSGSFGSVTLAGRLCKDATSGAAKITLSNTGLVQGTIRVTGQIPKVNETSAA